MFNLKRGNDPLGASLRVVAQVRFPQPEHTPSARAEVSVLTAVKSHALPDPRLGANALSVMPVVPVELDDQAGSPRPTAPVAVPRPVPKPGPPATTSPSGRLPLGRRLTTIRRALTTKEA